MKTKVIQGVLIIAMLLLTQHFYAQVDPQILWQKNIGGNQSDYLSGRIKVHTNDNGYIIGGGSYSGISGDKTDAAFGLSDYWILKLDSNRNIQWQKTYGADLIELITSISQTSDGGYIVGGTSTSDSMFTKISHSRGNEDYWLLKLNATGDIEWQKTIGSSATDNLSTVSQTIDGGYIVGGYTQGDISGDKTVATHGLEDLWVLKLDASGNILWQRSIGGSNSDELSSLVQTADRGYAIAASSNSNISGDKSENAIWNWDYWILKLDSTGNIEWDNTIGAGGEDYANSIHQTAEGGFIVGGSSESNISGDKTENSFGDYDYWVMKLNSAGNIEWQHTIGANLSDNITDIIVLKDSSYLIAGQSNSDANGDKTENHIGNLAGDLWLVKLKQDGNILWENTIGGTDQDYPTFIEQNKYGTYTVGLLSQSTIGVDKTENTHGHWDPDMWILSLKEPNRQIEGNIFADMNLNCSNELGYDIPYSNLIVTDLSSGAVAFSQLNGDYRISSYTDSAKLFITNLPYDHSVACRSSDTVQINFNPARRTDSVGVDFSINGNICSRLHVNISSGLIRAGRSVDYTLPYNNNGFDTARNAFVIIEFDTLTLDSINSPFPYTLREDSLIFALGNVAPFSTQHLTFSAIVKNDAVVGSSICTRAFIYPLSNCPPPIIGYDSSDIEVEMFCEGDSILMRMRNRVGASDMSGPGSIMVIEDEIIQQIVPYLLLSGEVKEERFSIAPNKTMTLQVSQSPNHPLRPIILIQNELCALTTSSELHSVVSHFPRFDDADAYEEVCSQIISSHDPNLKSVSPEGYTEQHFTDSSQVLEYRIDFQNTGTDTAFKVVIIDTLSSWLNINSFIPLVASHHYSTALEGNNMLRFIFDPIALPDSNISEVNSHGYVTFKIRPKYNTPKGTVIKNFADIYFDYNAAVRTNEVFNTIYDTVLMRIGLGITEVKDDLKAQVLVFPNPAQEKFFVKMNQDLNEATLRLTDISGKELFEMNRLSGTVVELNAATLSKGIYFINIYEHHSMIARSKIVIQ